MTQELRWSDSEPYNGEYKMVLRGYTHTYTFVDSQLLDILNLVKGPPSWIYFLINYLELNPIGSKFIIGQL